MSTTGLMRRLPLIRIDTIWHKFGVFVDEDHSQLPTLYW